MTPHAVLAQLRHGTQHPASSRIVPQPLSTPHPFAGTLFHAVPVVHNSQLQFLVRSLVEEHL